MVQGVSIQYGDIAPEAKENFSVITNDNKFDTLNNFQKYNMQLYNYANPCEYYNTLLDGTAIPFPSNNTTANIGLWSKKLSNKDGTFTEPIIIVLESNGQYSSQGFTLTFDTFNDIFPTKLTIQWFRVTSTGTEDLSNGEVEFNPTTSFYFCKQHIEKFNKVIIKFYKLNMPQNRLKLDVIDFGYGTIFYGDELSNVKCVQELNPISSDISVNTTDFTLNSKTDIAYSFQTKQPLITRHNGNLISSTFVTKSKRTSKKIWEVQSEDYISIMSNTVFAGDMYINKNAYELLVEIFDTAKVPYTIDENIKNLTVSGHIPYTTCRDALTYVAFAIQYAVDTSNSNVVKVFSINNKVSQTIELNRILQGQNFEDSSTVTKVTLDVYNYTQTNEIVDLYTAEDTGAGENIQVIFSEPVHDLSIINGSFVIAEDGTEKKGVNYAYINAEPYCILSGKKYNKTITNISKTNEIVLSSEVENVVALSGNTLINNNNATNVLNNCFDYYMNNKTTNLTIIDRRLVSGGDYALWGQVNWGDFIWGDKTDYDITYDKITCVGDKITAKTQYIGDVTGIILKQTFSLTGNNINKESVLK